MARAAGFTLVEVCIVTALAAVLATVAWPALSAQLLKARRADASAALQQVELAQARFRANNGFYTADWRALGGAASPLSAQGHYQLELQVGPGDRFAATARPVAGSPQAADRACPVLSLQVADGFSTRGPDAACWTR